MINLKKILVIIFLNLLSITNAAETSKLQYLNYKISQIKQKISFENLKKQQTTKQLTKIEQEIQNNAQKLQEIATQQQIQRQKIDELHVQITLYHQQIESLKQNLSQHVLARSKIPNISALKWFLDYKNLTENQRIITYYHYIIKEDQQIINEIKRTFKGIIDDVDYFSFSTFHILNYIPD